MHLCLTTCSFTYITHERGGSGRQEQDAFLDRLASSAPMWTTTTLSPWMLSYLAIQLSRSMHVRFKATGSRTFLGVQIAKSWYYECALGPKVSTLSIYIYIYICPCSPRDTFGHTAYNRHVSEGSKGTLEDLWDSSHEQGNISTNPKRTGANILKTMGSFTWSCYCASLQIGHEALPPSVGISLSCAATTEYLRLLVPKQLCLKWSFEPGAANVRHLYALGYTWGLGTA